MKNILWNPKLWKPLVVLHRNRNMEEASPPVKSFFDYQDPTETYEVRGILPRANLIFIDQD